MKIMKKFKVYVREVWIQGYIVEASSKEEAVQIAADLGDAIEGSFEYSHTLADSPDKIEVKEVK